MRGHESHVMADGSEHDARECPCGCTIRTALERLIEQLDAGELVAVRVQ